MNDIPHSRRGRDAGVVQQRGDLRRGQVRINALHQGESARHDGRGHAGAIVGVVFLLARNGIVDLDTRGRQDGIVAIVAEVGLQRVGLHCRHLDGAFHTLHGVQAYQDVLIATGHHKGHVLAVGHAHLEDLVPHGFLVLQLGLDESLLQIKREHGHDRVEFFSKRHVDHVSVVLDGIEHGVDDGRGGDDATLVGHFDHHELAPRRDARAAFAVFGIADGGGGHVGAVAARRVGIDSAAMRDSVVGLHHLAFQLGVVHVKPVVNDGHHDVGVANGIVPGRSHVDHVEIPCFLGIAEGRVGKCPSCLEDRLGDDHHVILGELTRQAARHALKLLLGKGKDETRQVVIHIRNIKLILFLVGIFFPEVVNKIFD